MKKLIEAWPGILFLTGGLLFGFASLPLADDPPPRGLSANGKVVAWVDGDTLTTDLTLRVRIRLLDCWAPEVRGLQKAAGLKSKAKAMEICPPGSDVRIYIPYDGRLDHSFTFGRVLGRMWVREDDRWVDVSKEMVATGFATKNKVKKK
jgi:endonuclease YncB( thermonuclease family)